MSDKNKIIYQTLGTKIQKIRLSKKITQEELASKIDKSTHFVSDIERGIKCPSIPTLINIIEILKINPNDIFCDFIQVNDNIFLEITKIFYELTEAEKRHLLKFIKDYKIMLNEVKE